MKIPLIAALTAISSSVSAQPIWDQHQVIYCKRMAWSECINGIYECKLNQGEGGYQIDFGSGRISTEGSKDYAIVTTKLYHTLPSDGLAPSTQIAAIATSEAQIITFFGGPWPQAPDRDHPTYSAILQSSVFAATITETLQCTPRG